MHDFLDHIMAKCRQKFHIRLLYSLGRSLILSPLDQRLFRVGCLFWLQLNKPELCFFQMYRAVELTGCH